jgi:lysine-specific demethylase/histidyl-hydroxylase NO66
VHAQALRAIADKLEGPQGAGMMTAAVHSSAIDFLMNRLPPHPKQLAGKGPAPTLDDSIWCRAAGWAYLLPFEMTGMVCEDDDDDTGEGRGQRGRGGAGGACCQRQQHVRAEPACAPGSLAAWQWLCAAPARVCRGSF